MMFLGLLSAAASGFLFALGRGAHDAYQEAGDPVDRQFSIALHGLAVTFAIMAVVLGISR